MTPLSPNELIERSLEMCHYQIVKGGVQLEKELAPSLPPVMGVSSQLEMALINLTVNAIHAMAGTGGRLTVRSAQRGDGGEIAVSDEGPGIPGSIRQTVFEPFVAPKPAGQGAGLGASTRPTVGAPHHGPRPL